MGILDKLYDNEYFGIVLFCVIAFLILMFIVILFFGVNDAKKTEKQSENKDDEAEDAFMKFDDTVKLDIPTEEVVTEVKEEPKKEKEIKVIKKPTIDLDSLIINKNIDEDENIELPKVKQPKDIDSESYDLK